MQQYLDLVQHIFATGTRKENRTGVDTISTFGYYYEHDMKSGFPLLTTKSISWKNIVIENLWFLSGQPDISFLQRHGCKFWDPWVDDKGKVPSAYGSFWTNFPASAEPELVEPRLPSGNDYVEVACLPPQEVDKGHTLCGRVFESKSNGSFRVIRFTRYDAEGRGLFDIQFEGTGSVKKAVRQDVIQNGEVRDRYAKVICGVGYYGELENQTPIDKDLRKVWLHMMDRCYNPDCKEYPWYGLKGVTVCKRWLNFANFHKDCRSLPNWHNKLAAPNLYALDKDFYSASTYSQQTCVWLRHEDNRLYAHAKAVRVQFPDGEARVFVSAAEAAVASKLKKSRVLTCIHRGEAHQDHSFSWASGSYRYPLPNNQIRWVLDEMRRNPMSRRMIVSAWASGNAQTSKLPPCHCLFAFNVQNTPIKVSMSEGVMRDIDQLVLGSALGEDETSGSFNSKTEQSLCLHLIQRSCDTALGVPYNLAGYAFLLQLFAQMSGLKAGLFGHTLIDAHVYTCKPDGSKAEFDHVPGLKEQCARQPKALPKLKIDPTIRDLQDIESLMDPLRTTAEVMSHFVLEGYDPHPAISFKVAV